ncbi:hypothetical protein HDU76_001555 [Blyttiomyces sp. JEL0837]|nr:hypothetical protein HDU76_001555 [Blyttiomyces sp. JEL0837]
MEQKLEASNDWIDFVYENLNEVDSTGKLKVEIEAIKANLVAKVEGRSGQVIQGVVPQGGPSGGGSPSTGGSQRRQRDDTVARVISDQEDRNDAIEDESDFCAASNSFKIKTPKVAIQETSVRVEVEFKGPIGVKIGSEKLGPIGEVSFFATLAPISAMGQCVAGTLKVATVSGPFGAFGGSAGSVTYLLDVMLPETWVMGYLAITVKPNIYMAVGPGRNYYELGCISADSRIQKGFCCNKQEEGVCTFAASPETCKERLGEMAIWRQDSCPCIEDETPDKDKTKENYNEEEDEDKSGRPSEADKAEHEQIPPPEDPKADFHPIRPEERSLHVSPEEQIKTMKPITENPEDIKASDVHPNKPPPEEGGPVTPADKEAGHSTPDHTPPKEVPPEEKGKIGNPDIEHPAPIEANGQPKTVDKRTPSKVETPPNSQVNSAGAPQEEPTLKEGRGSSSGGEKGKGPLSKEEKTKLYSKMDQECGRA